MLTGNTPQRIVHIITGLDTGGAEMMLLKLVRAGSGEFSHSVISLGTAGTIGPRLAQAGATVDELGLKRGAVPSVKALRLVTLLNQLGPQIIQGWMYHGNLAATFGSALMKRRAKLAWSVRCSLNMLGSERWLTRSVIRAGAMLSRVPSAIVYNSELARRQHQSVGYAAQRSTVIPNGFDIDEFRIDTEARDTMRERFGISTDKFVVGIVARNHPMKDHQTFVEAAMRISSERADAVFVAAGRDVPKLLESMPAAVHQLGGKLLLLPEQSNVAQFMNGLDVCVLCSAWGEGFPNVLGEAMACGVPCVATNVGDCASIIGDVGLIVPPRSSEQLASAILALRVRDPSSRRTLALTTRNIIVDRYSLAKAVHNYESLWASSTSS